MDECEGRKKRWWPFSAVEVEIGLALLGLLLSVLGLLGFDRDRIIGLGVVFSIGFYLVGHLVETARARSTFSFLEDGGVGGAGYLAAVRGAKESLLLQHVDDDAPSEELLSTYRLLLNRGVHLRRLVFLRPDSRPDGLSWISDFGEHENLEHRVVLPQHSGITRLSFVVVDERSVVVSLPGIQVLDDEVYASRVLLRHTMLVNEKSVARSFARVHEHVWRGAHQVSSTEFRNAKALLERLRV
jgi:hypothetical protein